MSDDEDKDKKTFTDEHVTIWEKPKNTEAIKMKHAIEEARATNPEEARHIRMHNEIKRLANRYVKETKEKEEDVAIPSTLALSRAGRPKVAIGFDEEGNPVGKEIEKCSGGTPEQNERFDRCVEEVKAKQGDKVNAYAVCTESVCNKRTDIKNKLEKAKLTTESRETLPDSAFCGPGRSFPCHDAAHVRNALARLKNSSFGSKSSILACIRRKAKEFGVETGESPIATIEKAKKEKDKKELTNEERADMEHERRWKKIREDEEKYDEEQTKRKWEDADSKYTNDAELEYLWEHETKGKAPKKLIALPDENVAIGAEIEKAHVKTVPNAPAEDSLDAVSPVTGPKELKPLKPIGRETETEEAADKRKRETYNQRVPEERAEVDPVIASLHQYANDPATFEAQVNELRQQIVGHKKQQKIARDRGFAFRNQRQNALAGQNIQALNMKRQDELTQQIQTLTAKVEELTERGGFGEAHKTRAGERRPEKIQGLPEEQQKKILQENINYQEFEQLLREINTSNKKKLFESSLKGQPPGKGPVSPKPDTLEEEMEKRKRIKVKGGKEVKEAKGVVKVRGEPKKAFKEYEGKRAEELKVGDVVHDPSKERAAERTIRQGKGKTKFHIARPVFAEDIGGVTEAGKQTGVLQDGRYEYAHEGARAPRAHEGEEASTVSGMVTVYDPDGGPHVIQRPKEGYSIKWEEVGSGKNRHFKLADIVSPEQAKEEEGHKIKDEADLARVKRELAPYIDWRKEKEEKQAKATSVRTGKYPTTLYSSKKLEERRAGRRTEDYLKRQETAVRERIEASKIPAEKMPKFDAKGKQLFVSGKEGKKYIQATAEELALYNSLGAQMQELKEKASKGFYLKGARVDEQGATVASAIDNIINAYNDGDLNKVNETLSSLREHTSKAKFTYYNKALRDLQTKLGTIIKTPESKVKGETPISRGEVSALRNRLIASPKEIENEYMERADRYDNEYDIWRKVQRGEKVAKRWKEAALHWNQQHILRQKATADAIRIFKQFGLLPKSRQLTGKDIENVREMRNLINFLLEERQKEGEEAK